MYKEMLRVLGVAALIGAGGCLATYEPGAPNADDPSAEPAGPQTTANTSTEPVAVRPTAPAEQTVNWINAGDAAVLAERAADEGPIEIASRHHACMKVKYETTGRLLETVGVNMGTLPVTAATNCASLRVGNVQTQAQPARYVYCDSRLTLGFPQYEARLAEATSATTASSTKLLDLFVSAASEIIAANTAAMGNPAANTPGARYKAQCQNQAGQVAPLFDNGNLCNKDALTCVQGYPATDDLVALCNRVVSQAVASGGVSALDNGKRIAVAAVLSAAHSCE